jgi:uncharacterized protein YqjF (DUF2071 family)
MAAASADVSRLLPRRRAFLTAEWRWLAMLNYRVDPALVAPHVPRGCELDLFGGEAFVSVVGFLFDDTRLLGVPIPFHRTFEEVNLRFYVRRQVGSECRRAVTFLREFVPRQAVALIARWTYHEPYRAVPMSHAWHGAGPGRVPRRVEYRAGPIALAVETVGERVGLAPDSFEAFISEHYWGYTAQRDGSTVEYEVAHTPWRIATARAAALTGDVESAYGPAFAEPLSRPPHSAWLADGSAVTVFAPRRVR